MVKQTSKRKALGTPTVFNKSGDEKKEFQFAFGDHSETNAKRNGSSETNAKRYGSSYMSDFT